MTIILVVGTIFEASCTPYCEWYGYYSAHSVECKRTLFGVPVLHFTFRAYSNIVKCDVSVPEDTNTRKRPKTLNFFNSKPHSATYALLPWLDGSIVH